MLNYKKKCVCLLIYSHFLYTLRFRKYWLTATISIAKIWFTNTSYDNEMKAQEFLLWLYQCLLIFLKKIENLVHKNESDAKRLNIY